MSNRRDGRVGRPRGQPYQVQNGTNNRDNWIGRPRGQPYQVQIRTNNRDSWADRPRGQPYQVQNGTGSWVGRQPYRVQNGTGSWVGRLSGQPQATVRRMQSERHRAKCEVITQGRRHRGIGEMTRQSQGDYCQSVVKAITTNNIPATIHRLRPSLVEQSILVQTT